jgi:hypothetical protein
LPSSFASEKCFALAVPVERQSPIALPSGRALPARSVIGTELEKLEVGTARLQIAGTEPELSLKAKNPAEAGFRYFMRRLLLIRPTLL